MRIISVLAALTLGWVVVLTAGFADAALGQSVDCRGAAADQYEECDDTTVTVVPPPERPGPELERPGPEGTQSESGGSVISDVEADVVNGEMQVPDSKITVFEKESASAPASGKAIASVQATTPAGSPSASVAASTEGAQGNVLPETGGIALLVPMVGSALLIGAGLLSGLRILRKP